MKRFPILYHKGKGGATYQWTIWAKGDQIFTEHGQIGGAMQIATKRAEPKNVGRSNSTSSEEQAIREAEAMWVFKRDRKYSETIADAQEELFLPMTAHEFAKRKGKGIRYPIDCQPKLDGVRAMASMDEGNIILGTRGGKEWTAPTHIKKILKEVMPSKMVLDGEFYIHGVSFEELTSWTKKKHPETVDLEYHLFDMPLSEDGENLIWENRRENLIRFVSKNFGLGYDSKIQLVPVVMCVYSEEEVYELKDQFVSEGYEGIMARNIDAEYLFGYRSYDLLKLKDMIDAEYKVVGFTNGVGKFETCVIWQCVTPEGKPFNVVPKGSAIKRREYLQNGKKYIGKWLKVEFQNLTADNIPRFPRGLGFRDPKDM